MAIESSVALAALGIDSLRSESAFVAVQLGTLPISRLGFADTMNLISQWLNQGTPRRVATANLDFLRLSRGNAELRDALNSADLVTPDGMPLVWLSRLKGKAIAERVSGSDLVPALLKLSSQAHHRVYFLGGAPGTAQAAADSAENDFPGLIVAGAEGPQVNLSDESAMAALESRIRESRCDLLLVGLGCPKQELFLQHHLEACGAKVGIGVGGSFDFLAGRRARAPRWLGALGFEWAWRLAREPRRLGGRYAASLLCLPGLAARALSYRWKEVTP